MLPEQLRESLSNLHVEKLQEAFDKLVESKVQSQIALAVKSAESNFDAQVNERLEKLVQKMEECHTANFVKTYNALNERVKAMRENYEKRIELLKEKAKSVISSQKRDIKRANGRRVYEQQKIVKNNAKMLHVKDAQAKQAVVDVIGIYENRLHKTGKLALEAMKSVKHHYERKVMNEARKFKRQLVESVESFVNHNVDSLVPYEDIRKAMKNTTAMQVVESLKNVLAVDAVAKMEVIKAPLNEAAQIITESKHTNKKLLNENNKLRATIQQKERELQRQLNESNAKIAKAKKIIAENKRVAFLNERLATLPSLEQRNFVKNVMANQPIEFIKENWDYTVKQFRTRMNNEKAVLAEKANAERKSRRIVEVSRRRLTEASRSVREAKQQQLNENANPTNALIATIINDNKDF